MQTFEQRSCTVVDMLLLRGSSWLYNSFYSVLYGIQGFMSKSSDLGISIIDTHHEGKNSQYIEAPKAMLLNTKSPQPSLLSLLSPIPQVTSSNTTSVFALHWHCLLRAIHLLLGSDHHHVYPSIGHHLKSPIPEYNTPRFHELLVRHVV